ncbi:MAG: glycosyltransferase [Pararhodobacter sp.]
MPEDYPVRRAVDSRTIAPPKRVAIVHYWLTGMRGGENVLEEIVRLYPQADIFTHVLERDKISALLLSRPITETFVGRLPWAPRLYPKYLSFMPRALEELDLSAYDLVISSESGPAKGVIVRPDAAHVCYCHSPMRYIWDHYSEYSSNLGWLQRAYFGRVAHSLRQWDVSTAARVDCFVANSRFVAERIRRFYNRDSVVVNPPVDLSHYQPAQGRTRDHFLFVSELVPYKRADLAVEAFRTLDRPLKIVGKGPELARLQRIATPNVEFLGRVSGDTLRDLYQGAKALIFPQVEDFGIVPVEAMACGTPVIAYDRGGARDSVLSGVTGLFFDTQDAQGLRAAVHLFEANSERFDHARIASYARRFGAERFRAELSGVIDQTRARFAVGADVA